MSLKAEAVPEVPVETARIARAALAADNLCLAIRDRIGIIYRDSQFQSLFPTRGQPAECPWRLALICILQFAESLRPTGGQCRSCSHSLEVSAQLDA